MELNYWDITFEDLITQENAQTILVLDRADGFITDPRIVVRDGAPREVCEVTGRWTPGSGPDRRLHVGLRHRAVHDDLHQPGFSGDGGPRLHLHLRVGRTGQRLELAAARLLDGHIRHDGPECARGRRGGYERRVFQWPNRNGARISPLAGRRSATW